MANLFISGRLIEKRIIFTFSQNTKKRTKAQALSWNTLTEGWRWGVVGIATEPLIATTTSESPII
jgi:hypothetical protein